MLPACRREYGLGTPTSIGPARRPFSLMEAERPMRSSLFSKWIERRGARSVARGLSAIGVPVTPQAVYSWKYGQATPRRNHANALVRLSGGELSLEQIYSGPGADDESR